MIKQISILVWTLLLSMSLMSYVRSDEPPTKKATFIVQDDSFPWYDRTKGSKVWTLDGVPESLKGSGPLPQQNCANRSLEISGTPKAITVGVSSNDLKLFKAKYPAASETGEGIAVKNPEGRRIGYRVLSFPNPPAQIGGEGGFGGGLLLLKIEGATSAAASTPSPKAGQPNAPSLPANAASALGSAQKTNSTPPSAAPTTNVSVASGVTLPAKENFHIYLLMGQSNMVGRDTRTLDSYKENPRVLALNDKGKWTVAKDPLHAQVGRLAVGVGPGTSFALEMLQANPKVTIGLVPCAVGGTPLKRWIKGGDLYENAVRRAKVAAQAGVVKGMLWHQGEAETIKKENADSYESRLSQMFKDLRSDLSVPNLPIVVGQLGEFLRPEKNTYAEVVRGAIKHVSTMIPNVGFADSAGLGDKGDKVHFSAESAKILGVRYAQAMQELQRMPNPVLTGEKQHSK